MSRLAPDRRGLASGARVFRGTAALALALAAGCRQEMHDQARYEPYEANEFFPDGRTERPPVPGTVARGALEAPPPGGAARLRVPLDRATLLRGRERFDVFCSPCHDRTGEGRGMIVQRGFRQPPSLHVERLRQAGDAHLYDVITNGFGAMPDYRGQIPPADRRAIVAYVRALQRSQRATLADVPPDVRRRLLVEESRP